MDEKTPPYAPLDVDFAFSNTTVYLRKTLGWAGVCAWALMIAAAKRSSTVGQIRYSSDVEFWQVLGMDDDPPGFTPDALLTALGRMKQTTKTPHGRRIHVTLTHFGRWNQTDRRWKEADRKRRIRQQSKADRPRTSEGHVADAERTDFIGGEETPTASSKDQPVGSGQPPDAAPENGATPATTTWTLEQVNERWPQAVAWVRNEGWHIARPQLAFRLMDDYGVDDPEAITAFLVIAEAQQDE